jgi:ABC-type dipeptide/oligopeptide/nickel transport system permease subunit
MRRARSVSPTGASSSGTCFRTPPHRCWWPITLGLAQAIIIESGLSFLGFGVQPPTPSWGGMLQDAQSYLSDCPWIAVFPGLMIFLTVVCCNVLSDFLGEATNPTRTVSR